MIERVTIKYDGRFYERNASDIELAHPDNPTDEALKVAMAAEIQRETGTTPNLSEYAVDRFETTVNIRPAATFG